MSLGHVTHIMGMSMSISPLTIMRLHECCDNQAMSSGENKGQVIRLVMVVFCKKIGLYRKRFDSFTAQFYIM